MFALRVQEPGAARAGWRLRQRQQAKTTANASSGWHKLRLGTCLLIVVAFIGYFQLRSFHIDTNINRRREAATTSGARIALRGLP